MSLNRTSLEVIAPNVDEAITKGLAELGLPREAVEIDILDEGSRGLFGLGMRQARIKLSIITSPVSEEETVSLDSNGNLEKSTPTFTQMPEETYLVESIDQDDQADLDSAVRTVKELLSKMNIHAQLSARYCPPQEGRYRRPILVDVRGEDLSILIGRHAETLNALQYISAMILSKELGRSIPLIIDIEGYRARRERQLRQLARRMAEQAVKTGRRQMLEPMQANERRIVHIELRDNPHVKTESVGEEPRRKVTIIPQ